MKNMKKIIYLFLFFIVGCSTKELRERPYGVLETVDYVSSFPHMYDLETDERVDLGIIGNLNFKIIDSLMIVLRQETQGFWTMVSLPDGKNQGSYLNVGGGPFEFTHILDDSQCTFRQKNNQIVIDLYDDKRGKIFQMNLSQTLRNNILCIEEIADSLCPDFYPYFRLGEETSFYVSGDREHTRRLRFFEDEKGEYLSSDLEKLNRMVVNVNDFELLNSAFAVSPDNKWIVESPLYFRHFHMIPVDTVLRGKTVCLGSRLDDMEHIKGMHPAERLFCSNVVRSYDRFFALLYLEDVDKNYFNIEGKPYRLLLFDWSGAPLASVSLSKRCSVFDIDFHSSQLYLLGKDDEFYRYDIAHILSELDLYPD